MPRARVERLLQLGVTINPPCWLVKEAQAVAITKYLIVVARVVQRRTLVRVNVRRTTEESQELGDSEDSLNTLAKYAVSAGLLGLGQDLLVLVHPCQVPIVRIAVERRIRLISDARDKGTDVEVHPVKLMTV